MAFILVRECGGVSFGHAEEHNCRFVHAVIGRKAAFSTRLPVYVHLLYPRGRRTWWKSFFI